ncbi:MAG: Methyltransferase type 12 [Bryobacterales bacterium]|nr:Methyltransferase type 12 [Bryobacterales bacterium]
MLCCMRDRKSRLRIIATLLVHSWLRKTGVLETQISANKTLNPGEDRAKRDLENALATFQAYLDQAGVTADSVSGSRIIEIGPGVNSAVALQFIAAGARQVICVDKFVPRSFSAYHDKLYGMLRTRLPAAHGHNFDAAINIEARTFNPERILYIHGGFESLRLIVQDGSVDFIVSNAVIEEIYDVETALDQMCALLRPGGYMIHKIDFCDYGLFSRYGYSPFEFLTIPEWIYRAMAEATGQPNRRLIDAYRNKFNALGYDTRFTDVVSYHLSEESIAEIRPRLLPRFRKIATEDLAVSGAYLVARKPGLREREGHVRSA